MSPAQIIQLVQSILNLAPAALQAIEAALGGAQPSAAQAAEPGQVALLHAVALRKIADAAKPVVPKPVGAAASVAKAA